MEMLVMIRVIGVFVYLLPLIFGSISDKSIKPQAYTLSEEAREDILRHIKELNTPEKQLQDTGDNRDETGHDYGKVSVKLNEHEHKGYETLPALDRLMTEQYLALSPEIDLEAVVIKGETYIKDKVSNLVLLNVTGLMRGSDSHWDKGEIEGLCELLTRMHGEDEGIEC